MFLRLLEHPASSHQQAIVTLVAAFLGVLAFLQVCDKLDFHSLGLISGFYHAFLAGGLVLCGMTAAKLYLPTWANAAGEPVLLAVAAVMSSLVGAVPLLNQITQGRYWCTLLAWIVAVAVFVLSIHGLNKLYEIGRAGEHAIERARKTSVYQAPLRQIQTCRTSSIG